MTAPDASDSTAGIDVGGTFTDLVAWDGRHLETGKVPSTPEDQSGGVINAVTPPERTPHAVIHGTTVAINALLEGRGATTALVTTRGFEDVLRLRGHSPTIWFSNCLTRPRPKSKASPSLPS